MSSHISIWECLRQASQACCIAFREPGDCIYQGDKKRQHPQGTVKWSSPVRVRSRDGAVGKGRALGKVRQQVPL